jgi:glutathione synthase/RimK-type ligase-like ATP-grasp enzyme
MDKHYFLDLMAQGIRMPKTFFIEIGENISLKRASEKAKTTLQFGEGDLILKPCISGGARDTYMIKSAAIDAHEAVFKELIKTKSMMLQEFQTNILTHGEVSLMVFDGQFTHAVLKVAKPGDYRVQDDHGGSVHAYQPKAEEIAFAEAVVRACPALPLYARVDLFKDNENQWSLVEVEIFEPELFFRLNPDAANVFAKTIEQKLNT